MLVVPANDPLEANGPGSMARLSTLELDDLLEELRGRAGSARLAHERMSALLDAVVAVSSDLDLSAVLRRIVESACQLVDAKYGALGVLGPEGEDLIEFVTHGVTAEERAAMGPTPHGRGLLGLIIRSPHPQRVDRISEHPDSYGFPANHPVMTTFLGAPVRIRDQVFGNLYMTDKRSAETFSADDEAILRALAAAAGVAIDNARLYHRSRSQQRWGEATRDLVSALLQGRSEAEVLGEAARRVVGLNGATACVIVQPQGRDLVVTAAAGDQAPSPGVVVNDPGWRAAGLARKDIRATNGARGACPPRGGGRWRPWPARDPGYAGRARWQRRARLPKPHRGGSFELTSSEQGGTLITWAVPLGG
jgi:hypothetical protein